MDSDSRQSWRRFYWALGIAALTMVVAGSVILGSARRQLGQNAERSLQLMMSLRLGALETGLEQVRSEIELWSDFGPLKESIGEYASAFQELGPEAGDRLRRLYVTENPFPVGQRHLLIDAGDGSLYSRLHAQRQSRVAEFLSIHQYYDVFMIDAEGNVVYTYFKEPDFGTSLLSGPWAESGLAQAFREAVAASGPNHVALVDFARYGPSGDAPAGFVASPVYDGQVLVGVLAAQIGAEAVNQVMLFGEGMGETGETYAVGEDRLMRSDSRFSPESDVLVRTVDTESVRAAFAGRTGVHRIEDYRGEPVISAHGLLEYEGLRWAIVAEKDVSEIYAPIRRLRRRLLGTGVIVVLLVGLAAVPERRRTPWLQSPDLRWAGDPLHAAAGRADGAASAGVDPHPSAGEG